SHRSRSLPSGRCHAHCAHQSFPGPVGLSPGRSWHTPPVLVSLAVAPAAGITAVSTAAGRPPATGGPALQDANAGVDSVAWSRRGAGVYRPSSATRRPCAPRGKGPCPLAVHGWSIDTRQGHVRERLGYSSTYLDAEEYDGRGQASHKGGVKVT